MSASAHLSETRGPQVWVLVINWNGQAYLGPCFDALLRTECQDIRFLLIDNGSTDGSTEFLRTRYGHDSRVDVLELGRNLGWAQGNNMGIRHAMEAGAEYIVLLNNDTVVDANALSSLVEFADLQPTIGALAPKMVMMDNPDILNSVGVCCTLTGAAWDLGLGLLDGDDWVQPQPVLAVCGGACLFRVEVLRQAGLLPDSFGMYLDDVDLSLRIWEAGYEVWRCPGAVIRHAFATTTGRAIRGRKYYLNHRNRYRLVLRRFPVRQWRSVLPALFLGELKTLGKAVLDANIRGLLLHMAVWLGFAACVPEDCLHRFRMRRSGLASATQWWPLLNRNDLFFRGYELPCDGWYTPRVIHGACVRPMSHTARLHSEGGRLRVVHVNCYPQSGATQVDVRINGAPLAAFGTIDREEQILDVPPGVLEFTAKRIFYAKNTGALMDAGGWFVFEWLPSQ